MTNSVTTAPPDRRPRPRTGPLAGVRIADFCWMGVGAVATRMLADFGAEVIKIENRVRLDMPRRLPIYKDDPRSYGDEEPNPDPEKGGLFNNYNRNKLGVTINMRDPRGREIAEALVRESSVVSENFAPGVMERWGLTYEYLRELRSDVIYARMSGFGHSGPYAGYRSYGPVVQAVSGLSFVSGLPGQDPSGWGLSYMDNQAAYYNSAAIMMAILNRDATGRGTEVDVSAVEVGISLLGPDILDVSANSRPTRRVDFPTGNRLQYPHAAPHGVYPSAGDDRWVAITVFNDDQWVRLVEAIGQPEWAFRAEYATQESRWKNQDELDANLASWTRQHSPHVAMDTLRARGVIAGAVQSARDLCELDPQIAARGLFFELDHPVIGEATFEGTPVSFSSIQQTNWRSAPLLGEDNHYVLTTILGMSDADVEALQIDRVI